MPINTGQSQVSVFPQFTAPDPRLVAYSPQPMISGIIQSMQVAQAINQIKEEAATRQLRLAATNAKNLSTVTTQPKIDLNTIAQANLGAAQGTAAMGAVQPQADLNLATIKANQGLVLPKAAAEAAQAAATTATANETAANASAKGQADYSNYLATISDNANKVATANKELQLANMKLDDTIKDFEKDKARHDQLIDAQIAVQQALAKKDAAEADYNQFSRGQGRPYQDFQMLGAQISNGSQNIARLYGTKVDQNENGQPITLGQWLQDNQPDAKGMITKPGKHFWSDDVITKSPPHIQALLQEVNAQQDSINKFRDLQGKLQFIPRASSGQAAPAAPQRNDVVNGYKFLGGDPADEKNWEAVE